jgi:hypothetical protein
VVYVFFPHLHTVYSTLYNMCPLLLRRTNYKKNMGQICIFEGKCFRFSCLISHIHNHSSILWNTLDKLFSPPHHLYLRLKNRQMNKKIKFLDSSPTIVSIFKSSKSHQSFFWIILSFIPLFIILISSFMILPRWENKQWWGAWRPPTPYIKAADSFLAKDNLLIC